MFVEIVDISYLYPFKERAKRNAQALNKENHAMIKMSDTA